MDTLCHDTPHNVLTINVSHKKKKMQCHKLTFFLMERKLFRAEHFNHLKYIVIRATQHETISRKWEELCFGIGSQKLDP